MIEYDVENVGALFTREEGKENATAENRVDESGGVAGEQPAVTRQAALAIGKIRARVSRGHAAGAGHAAGEEGLLGE